jgi:hypothetical protein
MKPEVEGVGKEEACIVDKALKTGEAPIGLPELAGIIDKALKDKFNECDKNNNGVLEKPEFGLFIGASGSDLDKLFDTANSLVPEVDGVGKNEACQVAQSLLPSATLALLKAIDANKALADALLAGLDTDANLPLSLDQFKNLQQTPKI